MRELLTAFVDHLNQLFAIFNAELGVKQHRFVRAGGQRGVHREDRVLLRVVGLQGQRRGKSGGAEQGGGDSGADTFMLVFSLSGE